VDSCFNYVRENELFKDSIRILVVDDFEPFRRFLRETLGSRPNFEIVGEAVDGLDAVQKAIDLQPNLILLDIGLPRLNGIEAATQICASCPNAKILFVTQETSVDIVRRAIGVGAQGYVLKTEAGRDLSYAVDAALKGKQFLSSKLDAFADPKLATTKHADRVSSELAVEQRNADVSSRHHVLFYSDDEYFLNALAQFVGSALEAMNSAIVIATESHRNDLLFRLQAAGLDLDTAIEEGRYISLDAASTASKFMASGQPDPDMVLGGLSDFFAKAMKAARGEFPRIAACGECSTHVCSEGNIDAAIQIERLTNQAAELYDVDILCGYPTAFFQSEKGRSDLSRIEAEHSAAHRQH
jgi:DNA-binding NarL/FixJ family response regulator